MNALMVIGGTSRSMVIEPVCLRASAYAVDMTGMIPSYATRNTASDPTPNILSILTLPSIS